MKLCFFFLFLILSGCSRHTSDVQVDVHRDAENYAIAACLADQEHSYLKDQGDAWASAVVQGSQLTIEAIEGISTAVRQEAEKGLMPMMRSELNIAQGKDPSKALPILYCVEMVDTPLVRTAIEDAVFMTERWLKYRK